MSSVCLLSLEYELLEGRYNLIFHHYNPHQLEKAELRSEKAKNKYMWTNWPPMSREVCLPSLHEIVTKEKPERMQSHLSTPTTDDKIHALKLELQCNTKWMPCSACLPNPNHVEIANQVLADNSFSLSSGL